MLSYVKGIIKHAEAHLTAEERSLLSVVYKNLTGNLRSSWRVITLIHDHESGKSTPHERSLMRVEKERIEKELVAVCDDVLDVLTSTLMPNAAPGDETVFYYKM